MPYPEDTWYGKNPVHRHYSGGMPEQTCPECDSSNLDDFDMAETEDGHQYATFRCLDCGFPRGDRDLDPDPEGPRGEALLDLADERRAEIKHNRRPGFPNG